MCATEKEYYEICVFIKTSFFYSFEIKEKKIGNLLVYKSINNILQ